MAPSILLTISSKSKSKKKPRAVLLLLILPLKYIRNYCHAQKRRFQRKPSGKLLFHMYGHVVYLVTCNTQWDIIGKNSTICRHMCMCMEIFSLRGVVNFSISLIRDVENRWYLPKINVFFNIFFEYEEKIPIFFFILALEVLLIYNLLHFFSFLSHCSTC